MLDREASSAFFTYETLVTLFPSFGEGVPRSSILCPLMFNIPAIGLVPSSLRNWVHQQLVEKLILILPDQCIFYLRRGLNSQDP